MKFKVNPNIFEKYPGVILGVIYISELDNSVNSATMELLRQEEVSVREFLEDKTIVDLPVVSKWREIYKTFGSKPSKFKSSIEALLRREKKGEDLPDINSLVNLYNALSLRFRIPYGAEDLEKVVGDVELTFSDGTDACKLIGGKEYELADEGEVVYKDAVGVICRKWNWREADRTKITGNTKDAILVFEVNSGDSEHVRKILEETVSEIEKAFGTKPQGTLLDENSVEWEVPFETKQEGEKIVVEKKKVSKKVRKQKEEKKKYYPKTEIERGILAYLSEAVGAVYERRCAGKPSKRVGSCGHNKEYAISQISLEHPAEELFGDFSSNIAMRLVKFLHISPLEIAEDIVREIDLSIPASIQFKAPGFINFHVEKDLLVEEVFKILEQKDAYGNSNLGKGEHVLVEHTSANPNKALHIGHIRNNTLGNSLMRLLEAVGYKVTADYIVNDRGASISKVMWGYLNFARKGNSCVEKSWEEVGGKIQETSFEELLSDWVENPTQWLTPNDFPNLESDMLMEKVYVMASTAAKEFDWIKDQISKILVSWEAEEPANRKLWKQVIDWVLEGQMKTLARLGSRTDHFWRESDFYKGGKEIVEQGLAKGVFREDDGAIITNFKEHGISDTVAIKSDGTALYLTQDLKLTRMKAEKFPSVKYIWVVGSEQTLTLKQAFLADHLLGIADKDTLHHFGYGLFNSASGKKIGSRSGNVVSADGLIDQVVAKALQAIQDKRSEYSEEERIEIATKVGIGALKYAVQKVSSMSTVIFDIDEALAFEGNSGPYIQYTYARANSILADAGDMDADQTLKQIQSDKAFVTDSEMDLLRTLYKFPEVIINAVDNYAPNYVADFIFDLAQKYNSFYRECPVLKADEDVKNSRLALTAAVAQVIKNGLYLLGIETLERM